MIEMKLCSSSACCCCDFDGRVIPVVNVKAVIIKHGVGPCRTPKGPSFTFKTELPTSVKALTFITVLASVNRFKKFSVCPALFFSRFLVRQGRSAHHPQGETRSAVNATVAGGE
jgi:hypothetical protein